jgi:hypothetical protein
MNKEIQIVAFDIPYPPDYGGVIDVYFKIKFLKENGVDVILHAFDYKGKQDWGDLPQLCKKIYSYKRKKGIRYFFHYLPYTVITRLNNELNDNLLRHGTPVIFEVLHTTGSLLDKRIGNLKTYYRHSNIEHRYYRGLASDEKNIFKKIYFYAESVKFFFYEKIIQKTHAIFAVNENDAAYFINKYNIPVYYIPSFHPFNQVRTKAGSGAYVLFHGNLTVNENISIAEWILKHLVAELPEISFVFAGKEPSSGFIGKCMKYANVTVESNPTDREMEKLISDAHINLVFSFNPEGLKLKMLYSLYIGRFVLISEGLLGTETEKADAGVYVLSLLEPSGIVKKIKHLIDERFSPEMLIGREKFVEKWSNEKSGKCLMQVIEFTSILSEK